MVVVVVAAIVKGTVVKAHEREGESDQVKDEIKLKKFN